MWKIVVSWCILMAVGSPDKKCGDQQFLPVDSQDAARLHDRLVEYSKDNPEVVDVRMDSVWVDLDTVR